MKFEFDMDAYFQSLDWSKESVRNSAALGMHDVTDDLLIKSTDEAPLSKGGGTLRRSAGKRVTVESDSVTGEVWFSATESDANGNVYNYALITHELGSTDTSTALNYKDPSTPGTRPKYLERPLKQNAEVYKRMIADAIRKEAT
ncbi:hypothetical protein NQ117_05270 [Paenibacillus sp. SC116]|uniref:hypothetical protein n=1 Tax=Paenibacillus sp. SC116 TaxID=2968986 RepID=UPI00215AFB82|nr:hypothetical protein [Paenibacillus sp. SC116]MCR8843082.1 hypothetical protein [Paenibacillus sp. SC116]